MFCVFETYMVSLDKANWPQIQGYARASSPPGFTYSVLGIRACVILPSSFYYFFIFSLYINININTYTHIHCNMKNEVEQ